MEYCPGQFMVSLHSCNQFPFPASKFRSLLVNWFCFFWKQKLNSFLGSSWCPWVRPQESKTFYAFYFGQELLYMIVLSSFVFEELSPLEGLFFYSSKLQPAQLLWIVELGGLYYYRKYRPVSMSPLHLFSTVRKGRHVSKVKRKVLQTCSYISHLKVLFLKFAKLFPEYLSGTSLDNSCKSFATFSPTTKVSTGSV